MLFQLIRMELNADGPHVIETRVLRGPNLAEPAFRELAKANLEGYLVPGTIDPKPGYGVMNGGPMVPEAVRLLDDANNEVYRYSLHDLLKDLMASGLGPA
jgi:hypothetical protein